MESQDRNEVCHLFSVFFYVSYVLITIPWQCLNLEKVIRFVINQFNSQQYPQSYLEIPHRESSMTGLKIIETMQAEHDVTNGNRIFFSSTLPDAQFYKVANKGVKWKWVISPSQVGTLNPFLQTLLMSYRKLQPGTKRAFYFTKFCYQVYWTTPKLSNTFFALVTTLFSRFGNNDTLGSLRQDKIVQFDIFLLSLQTNQ